MLNRNIVKRILIVFLLIITSEIGSVAADQPKLSEENAAWLLAQLKSLVDNGRFFDANAVSGTLHLKLQGTEKEMLQQPADCSNPYSDKSLLRTNFEVAADWFKESSEGVRHMKFPAAFINPAGEVGDLAIHQFRRVSQSFGSGRHRIRSLMALRMPLVNQESFPRATFRG
jgi:hypothetical protein